MILLLKHCLEELDTILIPHGFKCRGNAYFRVIGDGVLQVVKPEYERVESHYALSFGLFSMYDSLLRQWFSSAWCIPQYLFVNLIGDRTTIRVKMYGQYVQSAVIPLSEQLDVVRREGIEYLNGICTQEKMTDAMLRLDYVCHGIDYTHMNYQMIAPYLYQGKRENANAIIDAYLRQHGIPNEKWTSKADILGEMRNRLKPGQELFPSDIHLAENADMVKNATPEEIRQWLDTNYGNNLKLARFCM